MSKYIIEVDDNAVDGLFKAKGFNTLVFDQNGLDKLQKYEEPVEETIKERHFPQRGDEYYTIQSDGIVYCSTWDNAVIDCRRMNVGNVFRTKEEAEFTLEWLKVLVEMRKFAEPFDTKWDCCTNHYFIYYSVCDECLRVDSHTWMRSGELYFESVEMASECIKAVGEDRIKKYYLGVE